MNSSFSSRLYLVVGEEACLGKDLVKVTEQAIKGGVDLVQLREKKMNTAEFITLAIRLKLMLDKYNVPLIINDNVEVALHSNAFGVHVGNNDTSPSQIKKLWPRCNLLGYSIEYIEQLYTTEVEYADYLGISPVFNTPTKTDTVVQWGLEGIRNIKKQTDKPLVAIGGMNADNAYDVIKAGADCIAVVSAISGADDPTKAAEVIRNQIEKAL